MDMKLLALSEHEDLLSALDYEINCPLEDLTIKTDDGYPKADIIYQNRFVGDIGLEERNLFYLYRDNRFVGNKDLSTINFSKRKSKNIRTLVHTRLFHGDLKINCFNMLHNTNRVDNVDRNFICLSDLYNIMISKYLDEDYIEIVSLLEKVPNDEILDKLREKQKNKSLTYKLEGVNLDEYKD